MTNLKEIVDSVIINRGLNPTDNEFKLRGYIFFGENGNKIINYRDKIYPEFLITSKYEKTQTLIINNEETFKIIINKSIDYIIGKRMCDSFNNIKTIDDMLKDVLDNKLNKILNDDNRS